MPLVQRRAHDDRRNRMRPFEMPAASRSGAHLSGYGVYQALGETVQAAVTSILHWTFHSLLLAASVSHNPWLKSNEGSPRVDAQRMFESEALHEVLSRSCVCDFFPGYSLCP